MNTTSPHHVVVIGGGFGGLYAVRALRDRRMRVTLLDRRNFHLFQPLLYQVATAGLSPANIAAPLRDVLKRQRNCTVLMAEVQDIDAAGKRVILRGAAPLAYDSLIVATGVRHNYFGNDHWAPLAPGLKTIEDATAMRRMIFEAFETAERMAHDDAGRPAWLNFVVVGAGPTGVELAGALGEITRHTLRGNFRNINPADGRVLLVEAGDRVLAGYHESLSARAKRDVERLGVTVRLNTRVSNITDSGVTLSTASGDEFVPAHNVLWAAGVRASSLGGVLQRNAGAEQDRVGRVIVRPDLTVSEAHPDIFVIGDLAACTNTAGKPVPGVAPAAMQAGKYVANLIRARVKRGTPDVPNVPNVLARPFRYKDKGSMATIGKSKAVADLHWIRLTGWLGWMAWLMLHLVYIVQFHNRILVLMQWSWNYWTWNRGARLITGDDHRTGTRIIRKPDDGADAAAPDEPPAS